MSRKPRVEKKLNQQTTYRATVLAIINETNELLTGREIAEQADLPYKRTIDALNALLNMELIEREGRKFTARWRKVTPKATQPDIKLLDRLLFNARKR